MQIIVKLIQIIAQKQVKWVPSALDLRIAFGPGAQLVRPVSEPESRQSLTET